MYKKITIYSDGGARGNPGPAGIGAVLISDGEIIERISAYIGETTNNQAEYKAILTGLKKARDIGAQEAECFLDSELVVRQLNREYKVKDKDLGSLFVQVWNLQPNFQKITFKHIPRAENKMADKLVNNAIDKHLKI